MHLCLVLPIVEFKTKTTHMKALKLIVIAGLLLFSSTMKAQVSVSVSIGSPPLWGPVGYSEVRYYYLPDVEAYYDVETSMFIYYGGGVWIHRTYLPSRYSSYDLYSGYKVVMTDYRGDAPYTTFNSYKVKYAKGYNGGHQKTLGARPGNGNGNGNGGNGGNRHSGNENVSRPRSNEPSRGGDNVRKSSPGNGGNERGMKSESGHSGGGGGGNGRKR
jgi:hypothetical protein